MCTAEPRRHPSAAPISNHVRARCCDFCPCSFVLRVTTFAASELHTLTLLQLGLDSVGCTDAPLDEAQLTRDLVGYVGPAAWRNESDSQDTHVLLFPRKVLAWIHVIAVA